MVAPKFIQKLKFEVIWFIHYEALIYKSDTNKIWKLSKVIPSRYSRRTGSLKFARSLIHEKFESNGCSAFSFWFFGNLPVLQRARSGGVSRSDCRHVKKTTTPQELIALLSHFPVSVMFYVGPGFSGL